MGVNAAMAAVNWAAMSDFDVGGVVGGLVGGWGGLRQIVGGKVALDDNAEFIFSVLSRGLACQEGGVEDPIVPSLVAFGAGTNGSRAVGRGVVSLSLAAAFCAVVV